LLYLPMLNEKRVKHAKNANNSKILCLLENVLESVLIRAPSQK